MEVDLARESQLIYVIPDIMMTIGDFFRNIQLTIVTRGYETWQNGEANFLITRGLIGRLSNTPNVAFAYETTTRPKLSAPLPQEATYNKNDEVQSDEDELRLHTVAILIEEEGLLVKRIYHSVALPRRATKGAVGYDLPINRAQDIPAKGRTLLTTGLSIKMPKGTYARIATRSSTALKKEILIRAGIIDSDYRGEPSGKFDYYVTYAIPEAAPDLQLSEPSWDDNPPPQSKQLADNIIKILCPPDVTSHHPTTYGTYAGDTRSGPSLHRSIEYPMTKDDEFLATFFEDTSNSEAENIQNSLNAYFPDAMECGGKELPYPTKIIPEIPEIITAGQELEEN
ncbi:hypothetical protein ZIOFF_002093 [Zingiber officinale]|uniref:Deoxyuridine 5'-triphosphate nucleotidohydrolase n=1 Tax=Zingiber officinale TaxID=94328 RepID=A0A8J5M8N6_ZINOF|nr:hypothetical protein ZIOFF_002093 [Zingiber officinale]